MRINTKWGFGNAPLKPAHIEKTEAAINVLLPILDQLPDTITPEQLEAISHVKGQFTRTVKQDQWDWFTVWASLGRPSRNYADNISKKLSELRVALRDGEKETAEKATSALKLGQIFKYLSHYLGGDVEEVSGDHGYIYILSTRANPTILKIGMTQRTVEVRVKEINSATGVMMPYGIRAVWKVDDANAVEGDIHALFTDSRIRADREFFDVDFFEATKSINRYLRERRLKRQGESQPNTP